MNHEVRDMCHFPSEATDLPPSLSSSPTLPLFPAPSFIFLFSKYLLGICQVPGPVLRAGDMIVCSSQSKR